MKTILYLISTFFIVSIVNAQIVNLNPDPEGSPWIAGDLPELTPEMRAEIHGIPLLELSDKSDSTVLPSMVDNSTNKYMRPIFLQQDGSCGQASGVAYTYTYEYNRLRDLSSDSLENQYPTHFTYTFLNDGFILKGSWYYSGWKIIKGQGCPNVPTYGGMYIPGNGARARIWKSGYPFYNSGMENRVHSYYYIDASEDDGLEIIKHWLNDHNEGGESIGGLICFATYMDGTIYGILPEESSNSGDAI